jgi:hypothetical protein
MKKSRFSVEKIVVILKQAEQGMPVAELIRKVFPRTNLLPVEEGVLGAGVVFAMPSP